MSPSRTPSPLPVPLHHSPPALISIEPEGHGRATNYLELGLEHVPSLNRDRSQLPANLSTIHPSLWPDRDRCLAGFPVNFPPPHSSSPSHSLPSSTSTISPLPPRGKRIGEGAGRGGGGRRVISGGRMRTAIGHRWN